MSIKTFKKFVNENLDSWLSNDPKHAEKLDKIKHPQGKEYRTIPKKGFVHDKISVSYHKDRADFHHGGTLVHSIKGNYSDPHWRDIDAHKTMATKLWAKHIKKKTSPK
jgi:hypothetical protein